MIPDHRLAVLFDQVKEAQINKCLYHNTAKSPSLYSDHLCDKNNFPLRTVHELTQHTDEVWYVDFSHDGAKLATASRDSTVLIYETRTWTVLHRLNEHEGPVAYVTWSPDDTKLISCCHDHKARVWNTETGQCLVTVDHHHQPVTTAAWAPDGDSFITGSLDRLSQLTQWTIRGQHLHAWTGNAPYRIQDCAISQDSSRLVTISTERKVYVYDFQAKKELYSMEFKVNLTCVSISADSKQMLINTADNELQLLDITTGAVVRIFPGQKQTEFVIRNGFGGAGDSFVVSGSEGTNPCCCPIVSTSTKVLEARCFALVYLTRAMY